MRKEGGERRRSYLIFIAERAYASWPSIFGYIYGTEKDGRPSWIYTTGDCKRGAICKYSMIHWILAYKHPIFIRQAFRHPRDQPPPSPFTPTPSSRYRPLSLLSSPRRDRNLLFLNFCATPRVGTPPLPPPLSFYENFSRTRFDEESFQKNNIDDVTRYWVGKDGCTISINHERS